jgi:hypothetical protein
MVNVRLCPRRWLIVTTKNGGWHEQTTLKAEIFDPWRIEIQSGDCNFLRFDYSAQQTVFLATVIANFLVSLSKTGFCALVVTSMRR